MKKLFLLLISCFSLISYGQTSKTMIKSWFETGDVPTQTQFWNFIDNSYNEVTDDILKAQSFPTIKYYPYTSKIPGKLYIATSNPTSSNPLKYDGYFYATKLYNGSGQELVNVDSATFATKYFTINYIKNDVLYMNIQDTITCDSIKVCDLDTCYWVSPYTLDNIGRIKNTGVGLLLSGDTVKVDTTVIATIQALNDSLLTLKWPQDSIQLNIYEPSTPDTGTVWFDGVSLNIRTAYDNVIAQVNRELYAPQPCKNTSGEILPNGTLVRITGAVGSNLTIAKASNSTKDSASALLGMTTMGIGINEFGIVTTYGSIGNLDMSAYNEGDSLFLGINGQFTKVRPTTGYLYEIGTVVNNSATQGVINLNIRKSTEIRTNTETNLTGFLKGASGYVAVATSADTAKSGTQIGFMSENDALKLDKAVTTTLPTTDNQILVFNGTTGNAEGRTSLTFSSTNLNVNAPTAPESNSIMVRGGYLVSQLASSAAITGIRLYNVAPGIQTELRTVGLIYATTSRRGHTELVNINTNSPITIWPGNTHNTSFITTGIETKTGNYLYFRQNLISGTTEQNTNGDWQLGATASGSVKWDYRTGGAYSNRSELTTDGNYIAKNFYNSTITNDSMLWSNFMIKAYVAANTVQAQIVGSSSTGAMAYNGRTAAIGKWHGGSAAIIPSDSSARFSGDIVADKGTFTNISTPSTSTSFSSFYGTQASPNPIVDIYNYGTSHGASIGTASASSHALRIHGAAGCGNLLIFDVGGGNLATVDRTGKVTANGGFASAATTASYGAYITVPSSASAYPGIVSVTSSTSYTTAAAGIFQTNNLSPALIARGNSAGTGLSLFVANVNTTPSSTYDSSALAIYTLGRSHPFLIDLQTTASYGNRVADYSVELNYKGTAAVKIDSVGHLRLYNKAKVWNDIAIGGFSIPTTTNAPTFTTGWAGSSAIGAYYFQGTVQNDICYFNIQIPHDASVNDSLRIHVHGGPTTTPVSTDTVVLRLTYSYAEITGTFPAVTQVNTKIPLTGLAQWSHNLVNLLNLTTGTGNGISGIYNCSLERLQDDPSDTYTGNWGLLSIDCHAKIDRLGSSQYNAK